MYSLNVNYMPSDDWFLNLTSIYGGNIIDLNSTIINYPITSLSVQKTFLDGKWKLEVGYTDIFSIGSKMRINYRFSNMRQAIDMRLFSLSNLSFTVTFSFGKMFRLRSVGTPINNDDITTKR